MIIEVTGQITAMSEKKPIPSRAGGIFYKRFILLRPENCAEGYYKINEPLHIEFAGYAVDKPIDCRQFDRVAVTVEITSRCFTQRDGSKKYYTSLVGKEVSILSRAASLDSASTT